MRKDTDRLSNPPVITGRLFFANALGDVRPCSLEEIGQLGVISVLDTVPFAFNIPYEALQDMVLPIRNAGHKSWDIATYGVMSFIISPEAQGTGGKAIDQ